jgi:peroxiredoxin
LQRIHAAHGNKNLTIVGISQNEKKDAAVFIKEYGLTFPVLLDDTRTYPVSNAYGLTNVPTLFWIAPDGEIEVSSVGWVRKDIEELNQRAARASADATKPLFRGDEQVADFRAG